MTSGMHALSLYLDTSVIGGYFDAEFMADTRALWRLKEAGQFQFVCRKGDGRRAYAGAGADEGHLRGRLSVAIEQRG